MDTANGTRRGRGRPKGTDFESLSEFDKLEHVEAQLDRVIDQRSEHVASSSNGHGFETDDEAAVREFKERAREARRQEWASYHRAMITLHRSLSEEHEKKLEKLMMGEETLKNGKGPEDG